MLTTYSEQQVEDDIPIIMQSSQIEFPKLSGKDSKARLFCCKQFFEVAKTPLNLRVTLASTHLEEDALQWHQVLIQSRLTVTPPYSTKILAYPSL
ncbi:hypothetical protein CDL12_25918 [Handroanthus impetiginosus]|uniref:Uncharacterized protein n=1 Tax=Handroanthus impetiginosus TaxID=429701 RepID=A0A2G9G8E6_9LAMI|nr:hypothetical protein CDL12_25918 [Handroanthus impetiginosus]